MNTIEDQIRNQGLLRIKKIIDKDRNGDRFIIVRTKKNIEFMRIQLSKQFYMELQI